jgi:hypothetical protein
MEKVSDFLKAEFQENIHRLRETVKHLDIINLNNRSLEHVLQQLIHKSFYLSEGKDSGRLLDAIY